MDVETRHNDRFVIANNRDSVNDGQHQSARVITRGPLLKIGAVHLLSYDYDVGAIRFARKLIDVLLNRRLHAALRCMRFDYECGERLDGQRAAVFRCLRRGEANGKLRTRKQNGFGRSNSSPTGNAHQPRV